MDGSVDSGSDGNVTTEHCTDGVMSGDETGVDCGGSCAACVLTVESTDPEDGATDVNRDQMLRVVFSRELDRAVADGLVMVQDAAGTEVVGRVLVDRRTLIFTPTRYDATTTYTVTLSSAISAGPYSLAEDYTFSFTTGDTTSGDSRPPPDEYDPLGRGHQIALGRRPEYALLFSDAAEPHVAIENPPDGEGTATQIAQESFGAMLDQKLPVVGQFDDDGYDEVAVISRDAAGIVNVAILDKTAGGSLTATRPSISLALADTYDAAAGDFDLDGRDELFIAVAKRGEPIHYYLIDYDDATSAYVVAGSGRVATAASADAEYVKVAAGDVDGDGMAEAVIVWHIHTTGEHSVPYYVIQDDLDAGLAEVFPARTVTDDMPWQVNCHHSFIDVTTGDIDGDGMDEILFGLYEPYWQRSAGFGATQQCRIVTELRVANNYDHAAPASPTVVLPDGASVSVGDFWYDASWVYGNALTRRHMSVLVTADIDGDRRDEVLLQNRLYKFKPASGPTTSGLELVSGWPHELPDSIVNYGPNIGSTDYRPVDFSDGFLTRDVQVGDVDGDLREDIVFLRKSGTSIWVDYFDAGATAGNYDLKHTELQQATNYMGFAGAPRLALPNVDNDSLIVEPIGHDTYLGDNVITAVLAAPPCSEDIGQRVSRCSTTFGEGTTMSWTNGVYVSASAGIIVGMNWEPEVDIPLINVKLMKLNVQFSFGVRGSYNHKWATSVSERFSYSAGADNHLVLFESDVYDRYIYRIVSDPDPTHIGDTMSLSVPTGTRMMAVSQDYYNASNGTQIDIGSDVLSMTPGDLTTYPTRAQAEAIATADGNRLIAMSSSVIPAPEGDSNSSGINVGVSHSDSDSFSVGLYAKGYVKACGPSASGINPNICTGVEFAGGSGYTHSYKFSSALIFAGRLAGIPTARYAESSYGAGIFAYVTTLEDAATGENQNFIVVSYYVE
ncbi:MAG: hypothetical protein GXP55_18655 [Deltaproteobacteria bacterium]|nr:hypothetical protein [Deltaproteobacteria bacterium]